MSAFLNIIPLYRVALFNSEESRKMEYMRCRSQALHQCRISTDFQIPLLSVPISPLKLQCQWWGCYIAVRTEALYAIE